jgi:hypothetical protein
MPGAPLWEDEPNLLQEYPLSNQKWKFVSHRNRPLTLEMLKTRFVMGITIKTCWFESRRRYGCLRFNRRHNFYNVGLRCGLGTHAKDNIYEWHFLVLCQLYRPCRPERITFMSGISLFFVNCIGHTEPKCRIIVNYELECKRTSLFKGFVRREHAKLCQNSWFKAEKS